MASCENSMFLDSLLCESVVAEQQQVGSEILVQSVSELPSCSKAQPVLDSDPGSASLLDRSLGLSMDANGGCVGCGEVTESCTVDRDGLVGEHDNANGLEMGNTLNMEWRLNRCCLTECQSDVDGCNRESDRMWMKEGGHRDEDGHDGSLGDCEIPLEVIPPCDSSGVSIQQDKQKDDKSASCLSSEGVMGDIEEKCDIYSETKIDIRELVSPLQGCEVPSLPVGMEARSSLQQEEKDFNIISGLSLEASCEKSDFSNRTSPAQNGGIPSEVLYACDIVSNCDWKNEQIDGNGVIDSHSTERTTEFVEMKSNIDICKQILPSEGFGKTLEDLHIPDLPNSYAKKNDQRNEKIIGCSFVETATEFLGEKSDVLTMEALIHTQILPVSANVYYSNKIGPNCSTENSVSIQSCQTFGIADNSINGSPADSITEAIEMKSNIDEFNQILPPDGCLMTCEDFLVSDPLSVCPQDSCQVNKKFIEFPSAERVSEFVEPRSEVITDVKVESQILCMEEKVFDTKKGSSGLSPNSIHETPISLQSFEPFDNANVSSSEKVGVPDNNDSSGHVDPSTPFDRSVEKDHDEDANFRVDFVSKTKLPEIVALSSRRSGRSRKTQTTRELVDCRNTSKVLQPLGCVEIVFKAAGRKRSCLSKPARSSIWGLLGNVAQSFQESNRLDVSRGQNQGSQKRKGGQRSEKRNRRGASGHLRGSRAKSLTSTNPIRLKVKIGNEVAKSSHYITLPVVDEEKGNDVGKEVIVRGDKTCLDAPVLDVDLASAVLTDNSAEDVIENFPEVPSESVAVSGGSVGTSYRDPGTSPDSEVINLVPDAHVEARLQEDSHRIVLIPDKVAPAFGDFSTKRGKKKHKVPHSQSFDRDDGPSANEEKPSKQDEYMENLSQDICASETLTSSTCANASSNSSSDKESSLEPLSLSAETDHGISGDVLKVEEGTYCKPKSQSSRSKGPKPPKGRSKGCDSASKRGKSENQEKSASKKKVKEKAIGDQVACKVETLPESGGHFVVGITKANSVNDAAYSGVDNLDVVPVDFDKQYLPSRKAWVLCDDCGKWRRIPAELADAIDESKCTWTCKDNKDNAFADCSIPQEKSNSEINAELDISDEEDASGTRLNYKQLECRRPTVSQQNVSSIKTNQYLHRNRKTQNIDEIMVCHCKRPSDDQLGCGDDCLNRMLNIECVRGACPCGDLCSNQQFQKRRYSKLEKFRSGKKGFGLRSVEAILQGKFLIEYVGEVLDTNAYEARQKEYALKGHRHFYFMTLNGSEVIDACAKGNLGRFINHSCDPNCRTEKWMVNGEICIGLFALRDIKKGEEVTFDYNYVRVFGAAAKKCHCGSAQCQGYIGGDLLNSEVIVQDDSDDEYVEPMMIPEDGVPEDTLDTTLPGASSLGGVVTQSVDSVSTKEIDNSTIRRDDSVNRSETVISHIHDSLELEHSRRNVPSSVQPFEAFQPTEDVTTRPMSPIQQEVFRKKETTEKSSESLATTPMKVLSKSLSDGIDVNRKSDFDTIEDRQVSSELRPNVKTEKKNKVRITPHGNKIQVVANKSHVLCIKPKRLTEGSVEEKLNELLDGDGGLNKRKDSTKGYLKLLFLTAVSSDSGNGEGIQSNRDLSMILDALLKTKSRVVLVDVINKNGLRMLHNILKKYREDFKKIPILRKLLKAIEYLAVKQILTLEHINGGPPCPGMESFKESMLSLTEHQDKQVHQIARNFRDRWIPRPFRRHNFVDRDDSKMGFNRGSNCNRFSTSHDNWRDQSGRSTEARDQIGRSTETREQSGRSSEECDQSARSTEAIDADKQSTLTTTAVSSVVQESCSAPCPGVSPSSVTRIRKRKSRWDQQAETTQGTSSLQNKEQKCESGVHRHLEPSPLPGVGEVAVHLERVSAEDGNCSSSVHDNCQENAGSMVSHETQINLEDVPPGFGSFLHTPPASSMASSSFGPSKGSSDAVIGNPREKFISRLPVSYGIPLSIVQQYGTPHDQTLETWVVAPGIPFHPFPPLPPYPRQKKDHTPSHTSNHVAVNQLAEGQQDRCTPVDFHSEQSTPSTTGPNQTPFGIPCANNQFTSKRVRESSNDLGRRYFKQQKVWNSTKPRPQRWDRTEWGCIGNNSRGVTGGVGITNVANEHRTPYGPDDLRYKVEDLRYRVENGGNNVNQYSQHH